MSGVWRSVLLAAMGEPLNKNETFTKFTGRKIPPSQRVDGMVVRWSSWRQEPRRGRRPKPTPYQVDALGLIGQLLDQMVPGQKPRQPEKPKVDIGYRPVGPKNNLSIG